MDILDIEMKEDNSPALPPVLTQTNEKEKEKVKKIKQKFVRPKGMSREVFALHFNDSKYDPPVMTSLMPEYHTAKAKLNCKKVRPWKWTPFTNPARVDGTMFNHWRRVEDEGKEYQFAEFNKKILVAVYTEGEYAEHLSANTDWTKQETDHLFKLVKSFDRRWHVIFDRFDHKIHEVKVKRSVDDLKLRFYQVTNKIGRVREPVGETYAVFEYDIKAERNRKVQLERMFKRSYREVKDEALLRKELKRFKTRTSTDHQTYNASGEVSLFPGKKNERRRKRLNFQGAKSEFFDEGMKLTDYKPVGIISRSSTLKLSASLHPKVIKLIDHKLEELKIKSHVFQNTENIVMRYNKLREKIVSTHNCKLMLQRDTNELQSLMNKHPHIVLENSSESNQSIKTLSGELPSKRL